MELDFVTVDVFTDRAFGGNPLAVVFGAEGLDGGRMQQIAMEFNLSETTFVLPPESPDATAKVRIFTPKFEMPFAGHPNVGTAFAVARKGEIFGRTIDAHVLFEELAGPVPITLRRRDGEVTGAELKAPQGLTLGGEFNAEQIAQCCGLEPGDIETRSHAPLFASCGIGFTIAEVKSRAALKRAVPVTEWFRRLFPADAATGIHLYTHDADPGADLEARMFAPLAGIEEDAATGSAAVTLGALLAHLPLEEEGSFSGLIRQGVDMGRPSLLAVRAEKRGGRVNDAWVGGDCVPMMAGTLELGS